MGRWVPREAQLGRATGQQAALSVWGLGESWGSSSLCTAEAPCDSASGCTKWREGTATGDLSPALLSRPQEEVLILTLSSRASLGELGRWGGGRSPKLEATTQEVSLTWFLSKTKASQGRPVGWPHLCSRTHNQSCPHAYPPLTFFLPAQVTLGLSDLTWDSSGTLCTLGAAFPPSHPISLLFLIPTKSRPFQKLGPFLQINHSSGVWRGRFSRTAWAESSHGWVVRQTVPQPSGSAVKKMSQRLAATQKKVTHSPKKSRGRWETLVWQRSWGRDTH